MFTYKEADQSFSELYDRVAMNAAVHSGYKVERINNVPACRFYQKQGAALSKIDLHTYYSDAEVRNEIQSVWYLDI